MDTPIDQPAGQPTDQPVEKPIEKPVEQPIEQMGEKLKNTPVIAVPTDAELIIETKDLVKKYGKLTAVNHLSLQVPRGSRAVGRSIAARRARDASTDAGTGW